MNVYMKIVPVMCFLMLFFHAAKSQQEKSRLPFKVGNKYMIIDEHDKEILPPLYDDFRILKEFGIILMVKDGFCGVYDLDGKVILNHNIFCPGKPPYRNMPKVERVKNGNIFSSNLTSTGLLSIVDDQAKVIYYINPNKILNVYKPYSPDRIVTYAFKNYNKLANTYRVRNREKLLTFIDSTGKEIFKESFEHAEFIDDKYIEAGNNGKIAIFKDLNRITDFVYNNSLKKNANGIILMQPKDVSSIKEFEKKCIVLFTKTNKIDSTTIYPSILNGYIFFEEKKGFKLYDSLGNIILTHPTYTGELISFGGKVYIYTSENYTRGLMSLNGKEIFPPTCDIMYDYATQKLISRCSSEFVIYDTLIRPIFFISDVASLRPTKLEDFFIFGLKDGWRTKYGIIDINKKIIIEPKWKEISIAPCDSIIYCLADSSATFQKLSQNNPFLTLPFDSRAIVNCEQNMITYNKDKVYYQYDLNGKLILQLSDGQRQRMTNSDHKYVVKGDQKKYVLQDKNGATVLPVPDAPIKPTTTTTPPKKEASGNLNQAVIPEGPPSPPTPPAPIRSDSPYRDSNTINGKSYKEILAIKDNAKNESVYICAFAEKEHPSTVTYNDKLQVITPKGYSVPTYLKENNKKNPGTLFVINDISAKKDKYRYTSGICDYEGKWVVPPFTGYVKLFKEGLFIVEDHDKKALITYDQNGKRTNDIEIFSIDGDNYTNIFQNRILVSINDDPTYFKRAEMIFKNEDDLADINVAIKKIDELGEPRLIYGFIDTKGKLVLDLKYIKAKPFPKNSTKTIVAIERNGNIISQIIDTSGHVYQEFEYEEIAELDSTHYMAKKDSLWGITDKNGKALTTFQYTKIYKEQRKSFFQAQNEKKRYLIDSTYNEHYLGDWYSVNTEYLNAHYIVHISTEYGKESDFKDRFIIYNKNFKEVVRFDNIKSIEDNYNGVAIPPNLLYIQKDIDAKNDFFYDLAKGRKLMKE